MNKYLAVIKDAFREALASRVMWVVLVLITLLLLIIAPLGYHEVVTWYLGDRDVRDWLKFTDHIRQEAGNKSTKPTPRKHIWAQFDDELKTQLVQVKLPGVDQDATGFGFVKALNGLRRSTNKLLESPDLYDEESFAGVTLLSEELRDLKEEGPENLEGVQLKRFNRLLMEAAFPDFVRQSSPTSIQFSYAWSDVADPIPFRGSNLRNVIQENAVFVMSIFVGVIGILVAILITAPIIPQMFEPGSLHLLLSKPVSRWMLFLARYFGGCAFILIVAGYLIGGLWLILGLRFGVWDPKLLLSIPIYVFVFAIYYAVSALVGAMYRSPIVAVGLTVVFWAVCFLAGFIKSGFEAAVWDKIRFVNVIDTGDSLIGVNELGVKHTWDDEERQWDEVFVSQDQQAIRGILLFGSPIAKWFGESAIPSEFVPVGPFYDSEQERLLSGQPTFQPPGRMNLTVGYREDSWTAESEVAMPVGSREFLHEQTGKPLLVSSVGLFRLTGDPLASQEPVKVFGMSIPLPRRGPFRNVSPDEILLASPADAAMNASNGVLALYSRGTVTLLEAAERGKYAETLSVKIETEDPPAVVLGFGGETLLMARADGRVQVYDAATIELRDEFAPEGKNQPRFVTASDDGRWFAIVFHNGRLHLYDAANNTLELARVAGQGDISSAVFSRAGKLVVADQQRRVSVYAPGTLDVDRRLTPRLDGATVFYSYMLKPVYTVFPKPGELDKTFEYFLSGKDTQSTSGSLASAQQRLNPWTPVWSSAIFTVVVLLIACVYIEWQDF